MKLNNIFSLSLHLKIFSFISMLLFVHSHSPRVMTAFRRRIITFCRRLRCYFFSSFECYSVFFCATPNDTLHSHHNSSLSRVEVLRRAEKNCIYEANDGTGNVMERSSAIIFQLTQSRRIVEFIYLQDTRNWASSTRRIELHLSFFYFFARSTHFSSSNMTSLIRSRRLLYASCLFLGISSLSPPARIVDKLFKKSRISKCEKLSLPFN